MAIRLSRRAPQHGFADYNDAATAITPITLTGGDWITLTNDGLGDFTNLNYLPSGVTSMKSGDNVDCSELDLGDHIMFRLDFTVTPGTNNQLLELRLTLGTGGAAYTLETTVGRMDSGSGQPYHFSLVPNAVYMGDANTRDNPIGIQIRTSGAGTCVNAGIALLVTKRG